MLEAQLSSDHQQDWDQFGTIIIDGILNISTQYNQLLSSQIDARARSQTSC